MRDGPLEWCGISSMCIIPDCLGAKRAELKSEGIYQSSRIKLLLHVKG